MNVANVHVRPQSEAGKMLKPRSFPNPKT
jgi:hypothetical protein